MGLSNRADPGASMAYVALDKTPRHVPLPLLHPTQPSRRDLTSSEASLPNPRLPPPTGLSGERLGKGEQLFIPIAWVSLAPLARVKPTRHSLSRTSEVMWSLREDGAAGGTLGEEQVWQKQLILIPRRSPSFRARHLACFHLVPTYTWEFTWGRQLSRPSIQTHPKVRAPPGVPNPTSNSRHHWRKPGPKREPHLALPGARPCLSRQHQPGKRRPTDDLSGLGQVPEVSLG